MPDPQPSLTADSSTARTAAPTLVDTATAAEAVGVTSEGFRSWARYRGLEPVRRERRGRSFVALYDLDAVFDADRDTPTGGKHRPTCFRA